MYLASRQKVVGRRVTITGGAVGDSFIQININSGLAGTDINWISQPKIMNK